MPKGIRAALNLRSPKVWTAIGVGLTLVLALVVVTALLRTGGTKALSDNAALIGAVVALGGVFTTQMVSSALEERRAYQTREIEEQRTRETRSIEERRTQEARRIEERRVQEVALQQYFEQIGDLLRQGLRRSYTEDMGALLERGLLKPHEKDAERIYEEQQLRRLADVQTTRVLQGLAPQRKWLLLQFLYISGLLNREAPIVNLAGADLREAILCEYLGEHDQSISEAREYLGNTADPRNYLSRDDLTTVLSSTDARLDDFVDLLDEPGSISAYLAEADLHAVQLIKAFLRRVVLRRAFLRSAYLDEADLIRADLSEAYLGGAWLQDAVLLAANLNRANLNHAHSYGAVFVKADLSNADLYEADLSEANLRRADLSGADLSGATVTDGQLDTAKSLEGATLPDGSEHL
jgi:uncharacterized protein YjbI with pentapeptide repeats